MANWKTMMIWSVAEEELLLRVSLDYKVNKSQEGKDWETCKAKYEDITALFNEQYPRGSTDDEFPHRGAVARGQVTSKLKNVKRNYRKAVDDGRRSGNGRVVLMFFELCEQLWDDSPATPCIENGIETSELLKPPELEDSPLDSETVESEPERSGNPPVVVQRRRDLLQAKLNSHRGDRPKRKISGEQEDRELKRRMLTLMEDSSRYSKQSLDKMNDSMAEITGCFKDGFALMRELCLQPQPCASCFAQPQSSSAGPGQLHGHPTALNSGSSDRASDSCFKEEEEITECPVTCDNVE